MGTKLKDLKNFLADADRRKITDLTVQAWVGELRDAMYEATNILDICQLKSMERGENHDAGRLNPLYFMQNPIHSRKIGKRIKDLNSRLDDIKKRSISFGFINLSLYDDRSRTVASPRIRVTSGELDESSLVGEKIEEDTTNLVEMLTTEEPTKHENNKIIIFAIVGVGGVGKTTLAQKIFNHGIIQQEFSKKIWLSVNQDFSETELLRRAIIEAGGDHQTVGNTRGALERALKVALNGHKTLLVMDDVWNHQAWEVVLKTTLVNAVQANGSRLLITTRNDAVARGMMAKEPYHYVCKLEPEDAWLLLKKQVVRNERDEDRTETLKDIGMAIIKKCDCLPLAVKVMGGLLRQKSTRRSDWEEVLNNSMWSLSQMPEELNYAIYLSYEDLHPCLKQCFLHYSLIPKGVCFNIDSIIGMWISEGFVHGESQYLENLGRYYYNELILRNLIERDPRYTNQSICKMHDVIRSFAQYIIRDETLVAHIGQTEIYSRLRSQKFIRLSLYNEQSASNELDWSFLQAQKSLRTLVSMGPINIKPGDSLLSFSYLRTLHLSSAKCNAILESLYQLKHLRYLCMEGCGISMLPGNIRKLKLLQHFSICRNGSLVKLPNSIVDLHQLRYLYLNSTRIVDIPRGFCILNNLRKLEGFPARVDGDWCSLEELGPLSQLISLVITDLENVSSASFATKARVGEKMGLSSLQLICTSRLGDNFRFLKEDEGASEGQIEEVFDELYPPPTLQNLSIEGYFGQRFPRWMMSTSVTKLRGLRFVTIKDLCCEKLPDGLFQLSNLELLHIDCAPAIKNVGHEFLQSNYHHDSQLLVETGFPRLCRLTFMGMVEWEEWEWEEKVQAMPILEVFHIERCKLRCIPPGLVLHASALRELFVHKVEQLNSLENFSSVVHVEVFECPDLERISNLPKLQKLVIAKCPKIKALESVPSLQRFTLEDYDMETLPGYLQHVNLRHLELRCTTSLFTTIATEESSPDWVKFRHIQQVKAYTSDGENIRRWMYRGDRFNFETHTSSSVIAREIGDPHTSELETLERILDGRQEPSNLKLPLLECITDNFSCKYRIGGGGCGDVYKGILRNGSVAVKRIFKWYTVDDKMFNQELHSMMMVKHRNIVRLLGYCSDTQGKAIPEGKRNMIIAEERERLLCFEYISNGNLENHITDELRGLEWNMRYQIIKGICEGLQYLHEEKFIIHMDLKPANILIDEHMVPKITDFGISRLEGKSQTTSTRRFVTLGYCAPEYLFKGRISFKTDIYSLGIIIIETTTGSKEKPNITKVLRKWSHRWKKSSNYTPLWDQQVEKCLQLGIRCSQEDPIGRPFISDIVHELNKLDIGDGYIRDGAESTFEQTRHSFLNDMLGVEPLEIHFPFMPDKQTSYSIELTNDTEDYIAFRISPTNRLLPYSTQPEKGIVQPQSKCCVTITLHEQKKAPVHNHDREEFIVHSIKAHVGLTATDITDDMFNEELGKVVDEVNLPVVFDAQQ
ncbi:unnamed protein product [Urochloa humidicola]